MNMLFANGMFATMSPAGARARLTTFLFHKVPVKADPLTVNELDLVHFERILDFLTEHANIVPLGEASAALERGTLPARAVALTFDDGYHEWVDNVAPVLLRRKLPATFFVTSGQLSGEALWHERIIAAVRALPDSGVVLPYGFGNYTDLALPQRRAQLIEDLQVRLKYAPVQDRLTAIALLESQATRELILPRGFGADEVRALHSHGFEIGAHTVQHPILNECTAAQAKAEIGGCKEELEAIIRAPVHLFAYPNGRPQEDYRHEHVAMVKACGYKAAVATSGGTASRGSDVFQLPRFTPWGASDLRFAYQMTRNLLTPARYARPDAAGDAASNVRCLMIASTFPPIHGGSAVVYGNLCQHMPPGSIRVLAAREHYASAKEIDGWREHDAAVAYPVDRIRLLRPLMAPPPANVLVSVMRLAFQDLPLYAGILLKAATLVHRHRINVVCVGELVTGSWLGIALKKLFGCKLIIYVHGEEITTATSGFHGNRRRDYLAAADKVVAVSSFTCDAMTQQMDVRPERIALIQNGVDTARFTPGPRSPEIIARHGLEGKKVLLTVGRLVPRKGADMAMRAMVLIHAQRPDVHYLVIGEGELRPTLERMIAEHGLADCVTLVGKASEEDLLPYLRTCDLFIMPNRTMPDGDTEGFGLVFREANACRKPVIGGRAGGVVEAVVHGQSGYLVDGTDAQAIADGALSILNDEALAEQMSARGLQLARDNNTVSVARQFLTVCERLLNDRRSEPAAQLP